ncbi:MAG: GNAT family N-acetyltransferase [Fimbriiglobus sp.]
MNLTIRRANSADAAVLADFNHRIAGETEGKTLDPGVLARGVAAVLADPQKGFYTVAERAGEVVGQVLVTFEWSDWRAGWFWWVQSVYVRADARRQGVFRAVYEHILAAATADPEVIGIRLYVEKHNAAAQATYRGVGMEPEGFEVFWVYPLPGRESVIG